MGNVIRLLFIFIPFSLLFFDCKNLNADKIKNNKADSSSYMSPQPGVISKYDFDRYYDSVKDFYDNHLVAKGFNGGILVAKKGRVIFEAYHGYFNLRKKIGRASCRERV